jgi:hypothetical protein
MPVAAHTPDEQLEAVRQELERRLQRLEARAHQLLRQPDERSASEW